MINAQGMLRTLYSDDLNLNSFGSPQITRASHVEPTASGWFADLSPLAGPTLGPFAKRSQALAAEAAWIEQWLSEKSGVRSREEASDKGCSPNPKS